MNINVDTEAKLVEFFRGEGAALGQEGDDAGRTPVMQAIHSMRELLKRRDFKDARQHPPASAECPSGHKFYRPFGLNHHCPFCLEITVNNLQTVNKNAVIWLDAAREALR